MKTNIAIVKCADYQSPLVEEKVSLAVNLCGGITNFIKPASRVLVKPNLLIAKEPEFGVDTHPEVVRAVIRVLKSINCTVFVGDGPSVWGGHAENVDEVYERSGIKKVCQEEGVSLIKFEHKRFRKDFALTTWLDDCDSLVSISKFKTHEFTTLTAAVKNLYGLVWGMHKTELHKKFYQEHNFAKILMDIYEQAKPALNIVDAVIAMEGDGPGTSGTLRNCGLILAGNDAVAIDSVLAKIMGLNPLDIPTNKEAKHRGVGCVDLNSITILGEKLEDCIGEPFKLPSSSLRKKIPQPMVSLAGRLIRFYPKVLHANCIRCGACIETCPQKIISMRNNSIHIDYSKCISCFCCQEACPASAIIVKKSFFARMIGL